MVIKMEILNRKARFDYEIDETIEAGISLTGTEIKSIRNGKANIRDSYAIVKNDELYLLNAHISIYDEGSIFNHDENRTRKLLVHKKEIKKLKARIEMEGWTLIPLKIYFKRNYAKVLIGVARGKKNYDKRQTIKERDIKREMDKMIKYK